MNYLCINDRKIELTEEQIEKIKDIFGIGFTRLSDVPEGDTFKIGKYEFIVLDHSRETTGVILKDFLRDNVKFGASNDYSGSAVNDICNEFADEIKGIVGNENVIEHTVDLTANDGLKDYGKTRRYASLLTADKYRRYVNILDKYKPDKHWWLSTPFSTPTHGDSDWVLCVSPSGCIGDYYYLYYGGVRPFCIFDSNIFVSK